MCLRKFVEGDRRENEGWVCRRAREPGGQLHKDQGKPKVPQHFTRGTGGSYGNEVDFVTWDLNSNAQNRRRMKDGAWNKKNDKN